MHMSDRHFSVTGKSEPQVLPGLASRYSSDTIASHPFPYVFLLFFDIANVVDNVSNLMSLKEIIYLRNDHS